MPECFVIMPLTTTSEMASRYGGDPDHFAHVLDHLFVPAVEKAGFTPKKPIAEGADLIHADGRSASCAKVASLMASELPAAA
jgi:hypothetical protein